MVSSMRKICPSMRFSTEAEGYTVQAGSNKVIGIYKHFMYYFQYSYHYKAFATNGCNWKDEALEIEQN